MSLQVRERVGRVARSRGSLTFGQGVSTSTGARVGSDYFLLTEDGNFLVVEDALLTEGNDSLTTEAGDVLMTQIIFIVVNN